MMKKILLYTLTWLLIAGCSKSGNMSYEMPEAAYGEYEYYPAPAAAVSGGRNDYAMSYDSAAGSSAPMPTMVPVPDISVPHQSGLIFIKTASVSITSEDFDFTVNELRNVVTIYGGYFESSNMFNYLSSKNPYRRMTATIRVPAANYENARQAVESLGRHISTNETSREVSSEYYDLESRVNTKKTEELRLLALIEQATELNQIINLEQRLGEVRTDIELYESRLKQIDSLASYSTIYLDITESTGEEPPGDDFLSRLKNGFLNSVTGTLNALQGVVIFLAYISVPVLVIGVLVLVAVLILKGFKKKKVDEPIDE